MPQLVVLSVVAASFGIIAILLVAISLLRWRLPILISLLLILAGLWSLVLKIGVFNYAWQNGISMMQWTRVIIGIAGKVGLILAITGCAAYAATNASYPDKRRTVALIACLYGIASLILWAFRINQAWTILLLSITLSTLVFTHTFEHFIGAPSGKKTAGDSGDTGVKGEPDFAKTWGLTTRETEIARLIIEGKSNGEIAERLFISTKTVESHLSNIFRKMDVTSRVQIVSRILTPTRG